MMFCDITGLWVSVKSVKSSPHVTYILFLTFINVISDASLHLSVCIISLG